MSGLSEGRAIRRPIYWVQANRIVKREASLGSLHKSDGEVSVSFSAKLGFALRLIWRASLVDVHTYNIQPPLIAIDPVGMHTPARLKRHRLACDAQSHSYMQDSR